MIIEAWPVLSGFLRKPLTAGADHVEFPQQFNRVPDRRGIRIRSKIFGSVFFHRSRDEDPRILLVRCDTNVGIVLVILQHRVIFRAMLLDQVGFQNQRLQFRDCHNIFKSADFRDHPLDLRAFFIPFLKILADPVLQNDCLSDVDDRIMLVMHNIDAWTGREFFQFFLNNKIFIPVHPAQASCSL